MKILLFILAYIAVGEILIAIIYKGLMDGVENADKFGVGGIILFLLGWPIVSLSLLIYRKKIIAGMKYINGYVARAEDGELWFFSDMPTKNVGLGIWEGSALAKLPKEAYPHVSWDDWKPKEASIRVWLKKLD